VLLVDRLVGRDQDLGALAGHLDGFRRDMHPVGPACVQVVQDEQVRVPMPDPVIEVVGVGLGVPPANQRPVLTIGGLLEPARTALSLYADQQAEVEQPKPAGLDKQIGA
jgi:hypothetical protein